MTQELPNWRQLRTAFGAELGERVGALNSLLLRLERDEDGGDGRAEVLDALFREAHSLKGAARVLGLDHIEQVAHALESTLDAERRDCGRPPVEWFDAAYRAVDNFTTLYQIALEDRSMPPQLVASLVDLRSALVSATPAGQEDGQAPAPPAATNSHQETGPQSHTPGPPLPPPATAPATTPPERGAHDSSESVRVAVTKLDTLLSQVGELSVISTRAEHRLRQLEGLREDLGAWRRQWQTQRGQRTALRRETVESTRQDSGFHREVHALLSFTERAEERLQAVFQQVEALTNQVRHDTAQLRLVTQAIDDEVMTVRLEPVSTVVVPFERMVRDLARQQDKEIRLVVEGRETEIDRKILEQLRDPLMHMLRNAVDHGIESPQERLLAGKPRCGVIQLTASQRGGSVLIELSDDGAGLDLSEIRRLAISKGLVSEDQAAALGDQRTMEIIFQPGFSTRQAVTETSGRGVGMDVVRKHVEQLGGQIRSSSDYGRGTRFSITVPLTLATTRVILLQDDEHLFAVPSLMIERTTRVQERDLVSLEGRRAVILDGNPIPTAELADILELRRSAPNDEEWRGCLVLRQNEQRLAILTERLLDEQEIVTKRLGWPLQRVRNVAGAAVLSSGETVVVLNPVDLLRAGLKVTATGRNVAAWPERPSHSEPARKRVLVVDDSLTTRTLERSILEAAGYETAVAADGLEALSVLRSVPVDLVVSDVDMPRLDGFSLTSEIRRDERLHQIPVILVTSLDAREHRDRGAAAGADAYIVKSAFDQGQLLDTIGRLL